MTRLFLRLFFFLSVSTFAQNKYFKKSALPKWVDQIEFDSSAHSFNNKKGIGKQYLLISDQTNRLSREFYYEKVVKVLDADAIQSSSNIEINFDPSYEKILMHKLEVLRDGKRIDKLQSHKFEVIRNETDLKNYLYHGNMSAIYHMDDIRKGDIISMAYTRKGVHPFYKKKFSYNYYQQHSTPVDKIYIKLLLDKDEKIKSKEFQGAQPFTTTYHDNVQTLTYQGSGMDDYTYEEKETSWYNGFKRVNLSTFQNWGEVVEWALPKYEYDKKEIHKIWSKEKNKTKGITLQHKILSWVHFIQDDIRYMGIENGINAYQPHSPTQVYQKRYGDCKDKSLLLAALLREEGVEAYPMLVHSSLGKNVKGKLPSPGSFNHCIVQLKYNNQWYYVDPTISNQGGNLNNYFTPDYHYGLVIKEGNTDLVQLPKSVQSKISINELIDVDSVGGGATFTIRTEYWGSKADNMRGYFSNNDHDYISTEFEKYYAGLYDGVSTRKPIKFLDKSRFEEGSVIIEEFYETDNAWEETNDSLVILFRVSPYVLGGEISFDKVHQRKTPYYIGNPVQYDQITTVTLPIDYDLNGEEEHIKNEFFVYDYSVVSGMKSNQYVVKYHYKQDSNYVNADLAKKIVKAGTQLFDNTDYSITWSFNAENSEDQSNFDINWGSLFLMLFFLSIFTFLARWIYINFNPAAVTVGVDRSLGGWLFLPMIGLIITPFSTLIDIKDTGYFLPYFWGGVEAAYNSITLFLIIILEFILNSFSLVISVFAVLLFFQRRTSFRFVYPIFLICNLTFPLIDNLLYVLFIDSLNDTELSELGKHSFKAIIACFIWIPYIINSERSQETFTKVYNKPQEKIHSDISISE
ncbi:DUF3857 domain-containing protein [Flammeovirga pacifica]|uniref:DUF3857 domain-containing protein n=1 Tax=Flammeovirga pacifica TaxID=915059 RepID=A0A1S1Z3L2_FLAPC|nr:DUF3857 domain-containing protein [Flammeovirga pacifica]OHX67876.1 hypothetical protein NH26_16795 [Flammeovirga pacifica]